MNVLVTGGHTHSDTEAESDRCTDSDERKQPNDWRGNERGPDTSDDWRDGAARSIDIPESACHEVLGLREANDHRCRRQRKSEQCKHEYPLVTILQWKPFDHYGADRERFRVTSPLHTWHGGASPL